MQATTIAALSGHSTTAPAWRVGRWFNTPQPLTLAGLCGRVVVLHTFQMLCPACVSHALPQASLTRSLFDERDVSVIGLHTVFEHHAVMNVAALETFIHEYRLAFPIGVDEPAIGDPVPLTMRAYGLRGTPSVVVFDRQGAVRLSHFGHLEDMALGGVIGQLIAERPSVAGSMQRTAVQTTTLDSADAGCNDDACVGP